MIAPPTACSRSTARATRSTPRPRLRVPGRAWAAIRAPRPCRLRRARAGARGSGPLPGRRALLSARRGRRLQQVHPGPGRRLRRGRRHLSLRHGRAAAGDRRRSRHGCRHRQGPDRGRPRRGRHGQLHRPAAPRHRRRRADLSGEGPVDHLPARRLERRPAHAGDRRQQALRPGADWRPAPHLRLGRDHRLRHHSGGRPVRGDRRQRLADLPGAARTISIAERPGSGPGCVPVTPAGTPIIGRTRIDNVWVNAGHGHLGWTLACGSGRVLADLVDGPRPGHAAAARRATSCRRPPAPLELRQSARGDPPWPDRGEEEIDAAGNVVRRDRGRAGHGGRRALRRRAPPRRRSRRPSSSAAAEITVVAEAGLQALLDKQYTGPEWEKLTGIKVNVVEAELRGDLPQDHPRAAGRHRAPTTWS